MQQPILIIAREEAAQASADLLRRELCELGAYARHGRDRLRRAERAGQMTTRGLAAQRRHGNPGFDAH